MTDDVIDQHPQQTPEEETGNKKEKIMLDLWKSKPLMHGQETKSLAPMIQVTLMLQMLMSCIMGKPAFCIYADIKKKTQISSTVARQPIRIFVFST